MKKILVVEDEQTLREDILEILSYENFEVIGAENGLQGIEYARTQHPDLIICDIMMPELDGYGVLIDLHSEPSTANIPFIFLTAKTGRSEMRRGMELGADDYLTKPFTQPELIAAINTRLEKHAALVRNYEDRIESLRSNVVRALPHELRTPLTGIIGYSRMLLEDAPNLDAQQISQMAEGIDRAARRLHRLTENYLLYAQVELLTIDQERLTALQLAFVPDAMLIINDIAAEKAHDYHRDQDLTCECHGEISLQISVESLEKIVGELVDNAFKFSPSGTPVTVVIKDEGAEVSMKITNQGRGMTSEQITKIGAYMQFDRRMYEQSGLGLGLIIAKRLVELHQGRFEVVSIPEQTTSVTLWMPKHNTAAQ